MIQYMKHTLSIAICVFCLTGHAQLPVPPVQQTQAARAETAGTEKQRTLTFSEMGQSRGVRLTGTNRLVDLNSGIRLDELVTRASLNLKVLYPQGMRHDQSFIRVYVNDQLSALSQLSASRAGISHNMTLELDPTLFSDFATIRIEYDGTYDTECVDPGNPTLRVDIRPESTLTIVSTPLNLVNDLALLPAPFFDPRDNRKLKLPLVLPAKRSDTNLKAAGILASWAGVALPAALSRTVQLFAQASGALSLFVIGGSLVGLHIKGTLGTVAQISVGKLVLHPLAMLLVLGWLVPVDDPQLRTAALLSCAMPMLGIYAILSQRHGHEGISSAALLVTTVASFFTLSAFLWWLGLAPV